MKLHELQLQEDNIITNQAKTEMYLEDGGQQEEARNKHLTAEK